MDGEGPRLCSIQRQSTRPDPYSTDCTFGLAALSIERAEEGEPDFALTEGNAAHVAAICVMLDGLPLAIELAAGRIGWLSPEGIRAALGNRLKLLTDGPRDLPPRRRTLSGAIEWSYTLLEQRLFARLGVKVVRRRTWRQMQTRIWG